MSLEKALVEAREREAELQRKLQESEKNFVAIAEVYGSELAGDEGSERLQKEVLAAHVERRLLEACMEGKIDLSPEADSRDQRSIISLESEIFLLQAEVIGVKADLANRKKARELIAKAGQ